MAENETGIAYPLTKMNFLVSVKGITGAAAAFSEVTGVDASVDVVEFRQGNSHSLAPIKIPGLVKHGNVTLKMGYTANNEMKKWIQRCISETRKPMPRDDVTIELLDIQSPDSEGAPNSAYTEIRGTNYWVLKNAWVAKYTGPDLNASASEIAIESVELAFEELEFAKQ